MKLLATNIAQNKPEHSNFEDLFRIFLCLLVLSSLIYMSWEFGANMWLYYLLPEIVVALGGLIYWDNYLRWNHAVETVFIQYETLVIECRGGIFRRRKEIPLSAIKKVEYYDGHSGWLWSVLPDTLRVVYSNSRHYRFGLCLTTEKRNDLAKKIMDFVEEYY